MAFYLLKIPGMVFFSQTARLPAVLKPCRFFIFLTIAGLSHSRHLTGMRKFEPAGRCPVYGARLKTGGAMDEYLTIFEAARITKYAVGTLRKFVLRRQIPFLKMRRALRFKRSELEIWMDSGGTEIVTGMKAGGSCKPEAAGPEQIELPLGGNHDGH
jgi:excisionase family DNA binding protein